MSTPSTLAAAGTRMRRYSILSLARHALSGHRRWRPIWRDAQPRAAYDVVIIGGGGHGLATAYYLARNHGVRNIAVLEKAWIGGGNTGRNTTIVRSNYLLEPNSRFYEWSVKLWETLSQELNYNMMFSQRGVLNLAHSDAQMDSHARRGNAMRMSGIDAELLDRGQVLAMVPLLDATPHSRFPIVGALLQRRGGTVRHDAVAWGYARGADALGVDIIQNCEVIGFQRCGDRITGVRTTRGDIGAGRVGMAVAGNSSQVARLAGLTLPIESHVLQAFVTEPLKPILNQVVSFGAAHFYISQSDKGGLVLGGDLDGYNSYAQRGSLAGVTHTMEAAVAMLPFLSRLRIVRMWGGIMDMSMDGSPIIGKTPLDNLYMNGGWCYGGFKATPASGWVFAHTIAEDRPHHLNVAFSLDRFRNGREIDEHGSGPTPYSH